MLNATIDPLSLCQKELIWKSPILKNEGSTGGILFDSEAPDFLDRKVVPKGQFCQWNINIRSTHLPYSLLQRRLNQQQRNCRSRTFLFFREISLIRNLSSIFSKEQLLATLHFRITKSYNTSESLFNRTLPNFWYPWWSQKPITIAMRNLRELMKIEREATSQCIDFRQRGVKKIDQTYNKWFSQNFWLKRKLSIEILSDEFKPLFLCLIFWFVVFYCSYLIKWLYCACSSNVSPNSFGKLCVWKSTKNLKNSAFGIFGLSWKLCWLCKTQGISIQWLFFQQIKNCQIIPWWKKSKQSLWRNEKSISGTFQIYYHCLAVLDNRDSNGKTSIHYFSVEKFSSSKALSLEPLMKQLKLVVACKYVVRDIDVTKNHKFDIFGCQKSRAKKKHKH